MTKTRTTGIIILFLFGFLNGFSQNLSNKGKEFWVGYGHHQFFEGTSGSQQNTQNMVLYLNADQPATVTVSINGTSYSQTYNIPANTVISTPPLPKAGTNDCRLTSGAAGFVGNLSEGISDRGIHIQSNVPIVAYAHIYGSTSSGATMLMPVETYGYSYVSLNSQQRYGANNCFNWIYVIAKENDTRVEIIPSNPSRGGRAANVPFTITLNKGEVYQMLGDLILSNTGFDLTGTRVKSIANASGVCHPIAVFAGSSRTYITCSGTGGNGGDNIIQQIFPYQAWGKRYLTAPTSNNSSASVLMTNIYRVAVKDPTTVVTRNGLQLTGLVNNMYYEFQSGTADYIEADKPIMVAQYMASNGGCPNTTGNGDPEMMYISPIEQAINKIGFYRNDEESIVTNYLTLIIPTNGVSSLTIDGVGSTGFSHTYPHPNKPGYTVVIKRWPSAQAQCHVQSDSSFTAITYGLGSAESYGYNAGTLINNLNVMGSIHNTPDTTTTAHLFTCRNTPAQISMLVAYQPTKMVWTLSNIPVLSPNTNVTVNNPVAVDSITINGTKYYKYTLPGTYAFSDTGSYVIPVRNTHPSIDNCDNSENVSFSIAVKASPRADFTSVHSGCVLDTVQFNSLDTSSNGYDLNSWLWTFPDGSTSNVQNPAKLISGTGPQQIKLNIISAEGCVGDTTKTITVYPKPVTNFTATPLSVCVGTPVNFTGTSSFGGPAQLNTWYWDFGNGTVTSLGSNNPQTATYNLPGSKTVKHMVKLSNTCISDTVTQVITVYAKPVINLDFSAGCLPANGIVQFTNNTSVSDGQGMTYSWNFGDNQNSSASNPNTSTLQSPSHNFLVGTYTINYSATTANGCSKDTTFTTSFNVRAQLAYPSLTSVCASQNGTVSIAQASVTNGVTGSGVYSGPGTSPNGNFSPSAAGAGLHTIWYKFTSVGGCTDSISSTIKVHPKPSAAFTVDADICLNESATFTNSSTISGGTIASWNYNFGNGYSSFNSGAPFTRSFPVHNNYPVYFYAMSDSSCSSDTISRTIAVHPLPVVNFKLPVSICMPNGVGNFENQSTVADNSAMSYTWDFGDQSAGSTQTNPAHTFTASGPFNIRLTATSAYGCVKDTTKVLSAFYEKPVAYFTVAPDTLCQGADNIFDDLSSPANSTMQSWSWNFGDGTVSSATDPVKRYQLPGNYTITLTVKNAAGCISDPYTHNVLVYLQPVINAGPSFIVPEGTQIRFNPTANDSSVLNFLWTPASNFQNPTLLRPTITATHNQTYTLTATGQGNCTASDTLMVKILKPVNVPNSFSPNGDGINELWLISNLKDYPGCSVEVYNRYGQMVFQSNGYNTPWDGRFKGTSLPFATYYYIINLKNGFAPVTGSVTIVK